MSVIQAARHIGQLMTWGGGFEQRSRQVKAVYATVQSLCPGQAPLPADCLYYGWHSTALEQAVYWRLDVLGKIREVIWFAGEPAAPLHHTFLQPEPDADGSTIGGNADAWAAALAWFLLPPSLGEDWLFLLEQASIAESDELAETMPSLDDPSLVHMRAELLDELRGDGYGPLLYDLRADAGACNAYSLLPGCLSDGALDRFGVFYENDLRNSHVLAERIQDSEALLAWDLRMHCGEALDRWFAWSEQSLAHPQNLPGLCAAIAGFHAFDDMLAFFADGIMDRFLPVLADQAISEEVRQAALTSMERVKAMPTAVKERALEMGKHSAQVLLRCRRLLEWRWDDLRRYHVLLAEVAAEVPLRLSLHDSMRAVPRSIGANEDLEIRATTDVALEFPERFREAFVRIAKAHKREGRAGELHSGVVHHYASLLLHPGSVARGLLFDPEGKFLGRGGAVLVDPRKIAC